jgi:hypothetical protein
MKKPIYITLIALIITSLSACTSYNYYVAGLNRTNLSEYRTFAWMPAASNENTENANMLADAKIKDAATTTLVNKGLKLQQRNPDLLVSYSTMVGKGTRTYYYPTYGYSGLYPGFGFGFGYRYNSWFRPDYYAFGAPFAYYYGGTMVDHETYKEGTLIIDLIDSHTKKVVWRGFGVGEVHRNHQKDIDDLPKVVTGILDQLSLAPSIAPPAGGRGRRYRPAETI